MSHPQPDRRVGAGRRPVFVLCPPRSCSTVATAMLGGHPDLLAVPELRLFRAAAVGQLFVDPPGEKFVGSARRRLAGLLRAIAYIHDQSREPAAIESASRWLRERSDWPGVAVMDHLQAAIEPLVLVEKSPENTSRENYQRRFAAAYPRARLIHLVRHPAASVTSILGYWDKPTTWGLTRANEPQFGCVFWLYQHRRIERMLATRSATRVVAEALLADPAAALAVLLGRLGLRADASITAAMRRTQTWLFADPGPSNAVGGGDASFFASPQLRTKAIPSTAGLPGQWPIDPWTRLACLDAATRYGYGAPAPQAVTALAARRSASALG